ncbi:MAG: hypothetical protein ACRD0Z_11205 [Acidimicrobiales bacterium]
MEVNAELQVAVPVGEAWAMLTDLEREGSLRVHVGAVTATYKGSVSVEERDVDAGRLVLRAEGHEARGSGSATAVVDCRLRGDGGVTEMTLAASIEVTGRLERFDDDELREAALKLARHFVAMLEQRTANVEAAIVEAAMVELESELAGDITSSEAPTPPASPTPPAPPAPPASPRPEPIDLGSPPGPSLARRLVPYASAAGGLFLLRIVIYALRRRKK